MIFRPATPGLLVTLTATIILAIVSFGVPLIKSVYFLEASLSYQNINGSITLGTLGYCLTLSNGTTCSTPGVGYEFNPNQLLADDIGFAQIPETVVKWLTYVLVLHIIAFGLAAISTLFGVLAHIREMSMTCCSSCISGIASSVAIAAFVFDIVLFFVVKSRVNSVNGVSGAARFGNAVWLTLAAAIALFISECFFSFGRCCLNRRPNRTNAPKNAPWMASAGSIGYADQMRMDAVKAEADRKARQNRGETGLPAFQEYEITSPLAANAEPQYLEEEDPNENAYAESNQQRRNGSTQYHGGYYQAPPGTRAVDNLYRPPQDTGVPYHSQVPSQPSANNAYIQDNAIRDPYGNTPGHVQFPTNATQFEHQQYPSTYQYGSSSYPPATSGSAYAPDNFQAPNAYGQQFTPNSNTGIVSRTDLYTTPPTSLPPQAHQASSSTWEPYSVNREPSLEPRRSPMGQPNSRNYRVDYSESLPSYDTGLGQPYAT